MLSSVSRADQAQAQSEELWLPQKPPLFSQGLLPMASPHTHKRDSTSRMSRTLEPIDAANQTAIVVAVLETPAGVGRNLGVNKS